MRLSLRSFCSSSVSKEPSSTTEPASGTTSKAIGRTYFFGAGISTAPPSCVSAVVSCETAARTCSSSSSTPDSPLPDTAWYVLMTRRRRPASACSGWSTGIAAIVVQFGLATMPLGRYARASPLTSLTTSGTSGSIRQAEELSTTTAPAAANRGASSPGGGPASGEQRQVETGKIGGGCVLDDDVSPLQGRVVPAERAEAK